MLRKITKPLGIIVAIHLLFICISAQDLQKAELLVKTGHTGGVGSIAFSVDGRILASGSLDNTIKLWNAEKGEILRSLEEL